MTTHGKISPEFHGKMNALAEVLDEQFNGDGPKKVGFALLIYEFDNMEGRVNYIGNGKRGDVLKAMKEVTARWGQAEKEKK
jgi:DNA-directed RNA polymerase subunit E'/Rpb7